MSFVPYLTFDGDARAAMTFYAQVFGADDLMIMACKDAPPEAGLTELGDRVMHAQFTLNGQMLMASDHMGPGPFEAQASVAVSHMVHDVAQGQMIFERLSEGGEVQMPYAPTFFAPSFGALKDRFGTHWMIMVMTADGE